MVGEALLVASIEAGTLSLLGVGVAARHFLLGFRRQAARGDPRELSRADLLTLQFLNQGEDTLSEAARVDDTGEVRQATLVVHFRNDLIEQQPALHARQRTSGGIVGSDKLVG